MQLDIRETFSPPSQQLCRYTDDKEKFLHILILSRDPNGKCHPWIFPVSLEAKGEKKKNKGQNQSIQNKICPDLEVDSVKQRNNLRQFWRCLGPERKSEGKQSPPEPQQQRDVEFY